LAGADFYAKGADVSAVETAAPEIEGDPFYREWDDAIEPCRPKDSR